MAKKKKVKGKNFIISLDLIEEIREVIARGGSNQNACYATGISSEVFYAWRKRGYELRKKREEAQKEGRELDLTEYEKLCYKFVGEMERATYERAQISLDVLRETENPSYHAWFLERTEPERYSLKIIDQITNENLKKWLEDNYKPETVEAVLNAIHNDGAEDEFEDEHEEFKPPPHPFQKEE